MWSTVAASSAIRSGLFRGRTWTAIPIRKRVVRVAIELATTIGAASTDRAGVKCISPSHTPSSPHASAASTSSNPWRNAVAWSPPRRISNSMKIPKSMGARRLLGLDLHVLVGRPDRHRHEVDRVIGHTRTDPHQGSQVHDRREHRPVDRQLLDAIEQRFALFDVALAGLLLEQVVDVGVAAIGVGALGVHELGHAAGGVAGGPRSEEHTSE